MKIVIGGTYQRYREWLRENQLSERDATYVGLNEEKLIGMELAESDVVRIGAVDWEFEQFLKTRIRK